MGQRQRVAVARDKCVSSPLTDRELLISAVWGLNAIRPLVPELQKIAHACGQAGSMHGLELLLGSRFVRRKQPCLVCFRQPANPPAGPAPMVGAVLLLEYRILGMRIGLFATADSFGVRNVVGPHALHGRFCLMTTRFLLGLRARLVLATWRPAPSQAPGVHTSSLDPEGFLYACSKRTVQDTLLLSSTAEQTLKALGKRTRVHLRAARRKFNRDFPAAQLLDATESLRHAGDEVLQQLNQSSLDVIDQAEFNHQVRSVCKSSGGFVLGILLEGRWIALVGGWRQDRSTWIEWQCNGRGLERYSMGSVLRTYLLEEEAARGAANLGFHGGTSHSMLHRFQQTPVADLLGRRPGVTVTVAIALVSWLCKRWPRLLQRGNFLFNALCTPGLAWTAHAPVASSPDHLPDI